MYSLATIFRAPNRALLGRLCTRGCAFAVSRPVRLAVESHQPVVALESTIITHGMPYPTNVVTAIGIENIVRSRGAVPATIGVIDGTIRVGMTQDEIEHLGSNAQFCRKISRRDFPVVLSEGLSGGTTVSGTMVAAKKAGIEVFVTGGIGGVHRGAETSFDVSADLTELGRTPVAVICAGSKSILDIGLTLEYLETQGVCVVTLGDMDDFPAFLSRTSGFKSDWHVATPAQCAKLIHEGFSLNAGSGIVVGVPIPKEHAADSALIEDAVQQGIAEAKKLNIQGRDMTPFLLDFVNKNTGGASLQANIALVKNNAEVGAQVAVELAKLKLKQTPSRGKKEANQPVIAGAAIVDFVAKAGTELRPDTGATIPGRISQTFGGVGRNVAECVARLGGRPFFASVTGDDVTGAALRHHWVEQVEAPSAGIKVLAGKSTAAYCVVIRKDGELELGMGDMEINEAIDPKDYREHLLQASLVCFDGNLTVDAIRYVCDVCFEYGVPVWFEPTCVEKAKKPVLCNVHEKITHMTPNYAELQSFCSALGVKLPANFKSMDPLTGSVALSEKALDYVPRVTTTLGKDGVLVARNWEKLPGRGSESSGRIVDGKSYAHFAPARDEMMPVSVVSVSGAGDCLTGGMIFGTLRGFGWSNCVRAGLRAAYASLLSAGTVSDQLDSADFMEDELEKWGPDFVDVSHLLQQKEGH